MYQAQFGSSLGQRINRNKLPTRLFNSGDRFSSFQSPLPSDRQLQQFSFFQSAKKPEYSKNLFNHGKQMLVHQLPLQYEAFLRRQHNNLALCGMETISKMQKYGKPEPHIREQIENREDKQNDSLKYNYMQTVSRELNAIKEEERQYYLDSIYSPSAFTPKVTHRNYTTVKPSRIMDPQHDLLYNEIKLQATIRLEEQRLKTEQLRLNYALLQQQNIGLKQNIFHLQNQLNKSALTYCQKIEKPSQQVKNQILRQQLKQKFLDEIANLQSRFKKMQQQISKYKLKQEQRVENLLKMHQQAQKKTKNSVDEYYARFAEVFLHMVQKLPINIQADWPEKKKIAVGWKIVKYYVKKALKLGIPPPNIDVKDDLQ